MKKLLKTTFILTVSILVFFVDIGLFGFKNLCYASENTSNDVSEKINLLEDVSTKNIVEATQNNPYFIDESKIEEDAVVAQENISYEGDRAGSGLDLLGPYQGLTYYSQADSRWANDLYTSTGNKSQTLKSSGCGPTAAAIIVSSAKGAILPTTMGKLFVERGYRTQNSGTAWSAFSFVADYFKFKEYYTDSSLNNALKYLQEKNSNGTSKYYIVCSVRKRIVYQWRALCCFSWNEWRYNKYI